MPSRLMIYAFGSCKSDCAASTLRKTAVALSNQVSTLVTYSYMGSRLTNVVNGSYSVGYGYVANLPQATQLTAAQSGTTRMTIKKTYDNLNRLISINTTTNASAVPAFAFSYLYNDANQRTHANVGGTVP